MKKIILVFVAATVSVLTASAQQRTILYEEFTGENCGPCAAANPGLESMMASNTGKIIHVTYMEPVPTTGYFYKSVQALNDARFQSYYGPIWSSFGGLEFTPSGFIDGYLPDSTAPAPPYPCGDCGNVAAFTQSDIDVEYPRPSPFKITATHHFSTAHDSVYGKVIVKGVTTYGSAHLKLRVAYVKTMNFTHEPGNNGETHFENVARAMFPSETGQTIASSWTTSTVDTYSYSGKISHLDTFTNVTIVDSNFVVWIQNDSLGAVTAAAFRVQQAAMSVYTPDTVPTVSHAGVKQIATTFTSLKIYPNPSKETAIVSFTLEQAADVSAKIADELGRIVKSIPVRNMSVGDQKINVSTGELAAGNYSVILRFGDETVSQKLSVVK